METSSDDCESYSAKRSQQSSQKITKKNDSSDASSSNASSFKSSNKTCSEKIYVPSFKCVIVNGQEDDIDQKSETSEESSISFVKQQ